MMIWHGCLYTVECKDARERCKARENLCQYIGLLSTSMSPQTLPLPVGRPHPSIFEKITYEPSKKKVFYHTKYNGRSCASMRSLHKDIRVPKYWSENVKLFKAADFCDQQKVESTGCGKDAGKNEGFVIIFIFPFFYVNCRARSVYFVIIFFVDFCNPLVFLGIFLVEHLL